MSRQSGTPLAQKLGIGEGSTVAVLHAPIDVLAEFPAGVVVKRQARGRADVVVIFVTERAELERRVESLGTMIFPAGGLWVAWPKHSSGVSTDMDDHAVRAIALPLGLVDNKVCAVDETWTALRLVWRKERRTIADV